MQGDVTAPSSSSDIAPSTTVGQGRAVTTVTQSTPTPGPSIPVSDTLTHTLTTSTILTSTCLQEISSLVGEERVESSEAEAVAGEEQGEPMQTDSHPDDVMSSAGSVLQVHGESGEVAQVCFWFTTGI